MGLPCRRSFCGEWRDQGLANLLSRVVHVVSVPVLSGVPGATFAEMDRKRLNVSLSTTSAAQAPAQRSGVTTMSARVQSSATAWACRLQATGPQMRYAGAPEASHQPASALQARPHVRRRAEHLRPPAYFPCLSMLGHARPLAMFK